MGVRMYTHYIFPTPPPLPRTMRHLSSAGRHCLTSVAAMEKESREYLISFCYSVALVCVAAAVPSFIL